MEIDGAESMTEQALLEVRHLHKSFGSQMAVNNVSFDAHAGELLAIMRGQKHYLQFGQRTAATRQR